MYQKIDLFSGNIRFSITGLIIDIILLLHYCISWYIYFKKYKNFASYWHFFLLIPFVIPTFLIYPFSASYRNYISTGDTYFLLEKNVDKAFYITSLGYVGLNVGRYLFLLIKKHNIFSFIIPAGNIVRKMVYVNLRNKYSLIVLFGISFFFTSIITIVQFKAGYAFNPRSYFFHDGRLRPFFNLTNIVSSMAILYLGINVIAHKRTLFNILFIILLLGTLFLGGRGGLINPLVTLIVFYNLKTNKLNFIKLSIYGGLLAIIALYLGNLRNGIYNISDVFSNAMDLIFYGNNFSDVRDFAWILSYWDENYVHGYTYLAAFLSFVPRFLSNFRDSWSLSVFTDRLVGFPTEHPGLRPGMFGESYLNFGLIGVLIIGMLCGYLLAYVDFQARQWAKKDVKKAYSYTVFSTLVTNLVITAGFFYIYVFLIINLLLFFISLVTKKEKYIFSGDG